jgi:ABC-2 type transport system ATP-binding protein
VPVLELDRLTRRFGDLVALDGLSFAVEPGQMFGFVGSNGAGKTTAMRIVMGVDEPDAGEVRWQGARSTGPPARRSATCRRSAGCTRR